MYTKQRQDTIRVTAVFASYNDRPAPAPERSYNLEVDLGQWARAMPIAHESSPCLSSALRYLAISSQGPTRGQGSNLKLEEESARGYAGKIDGGRMAMVFTAPR